MDLSQFLFCVAVVITIIVAYLVGKEVGLAEGRKQTAKALDRVNRLRDR